MKINIKSTVYAATGLMGKKVWIGPSFVSAAKGAVDGTNDYNGKL